MTREFNLDTGSFRDPGAYVFDDGGRILRGVTKKRATEFKEIYDSGIFDILAGKGLMVSCNKIDAPSPELEQLIGARGERIVDFYEHPRIPFISYPYEWTFSQLKDAALAHLDLQIVAFEYGFVLSDATPYNIQFIKCSPVHIDVFSVRKYVNGQIWEGYNQYCRQFLLPLLIEAWTGVPFQPLLRGNIDGVNFSDALSILPKHRLLINLSALMHVYFHGKAVMRNSSSSKHLKMARKINPRNYIAILKQLRDFIATLKSKKRTGSYWNEYATLNSYSTFMKDVKVAFIEDWASKHKPRQILDIGGNTGEYSRAAIRGGAYSSIILDNDIDSVESAYFESIQSKDDIFPILMNLRDPTPDMGWRQKERKGLKERAHADGVIALAVIHHLVMGGNIPLKDVVGWLMDMAPNGVLEFVPKSDPMAAGLLSMRDDVYDDYEESIFREAIMDRGDITSEHYFAENGRLLVAYSRP